MRRSTVLAAAFLVLLGFWAFREDGSARSAERASGGPSPTTADSKTHTPTPAPATTTDDPGPLRVVTFGDSVASGSRCDCSDFPSRVAARLGSDLHRRVDSTNLARAGFTSSDVVSQLHSPATVSHLADADLVLVEIGANDFPESLADDPSCLPSRPCDQPGLDVLRDHLETIVQRVVDTPGPPDRVLALIGYWNVFRDGAVARARGDAYVAGSDNLTRQVNAVVAGVAARTDAMYVDVYGPWAAIDDPTDHLAADGDHPNDAGHALLAESVVDAVEQLRVLEKAS